MEAGNIWAIRAAAALTLVVGLHAVAGGVGEVPGTITLCHEDHDVRPWRYGNGGGLNFRLIESAGRQAGLSLRFEAMPWKQCMARLRANQVDGVFAASFRPGQPADGVYPGGVAPDDGKRLYMERFVLVRRKGDRLDWDGASLSRLQGAVGIQAGFQVGEHLRTLGVPTAESGGDADDVLRLLVAGRVGGAALLAGEAAKLLEHDPALRSALEVLPTPLMETPYYLVLSQSFFQRHPKRAENLWRAVETARDSAAYRLLERRTLTALGQS